MVGIDRETGKVKIIISFRSNPMGNRKFIKYCKKLEKKQLWLLFKQKLVGNGRERDKNTKYRFLSFRSYPMRNRKLQTNSNKNQKIIKHY